MKTLYYYRKGIFFHRDKDKIEEAYQELRITNSAESVISYEYKDQNARGSIRTSDLDVPSCNVAAHYIQASMYSEKPTIKSDLNYFLLTKLTSEIRSNYDEIKKLKSALKEL